MSVFVFFILLLIATTRSSWATYNISARYWSSRFDYIEIWSLYYGRTQIKMPETSAQDHFYGVKFDITDSFLFISKEIFWKFKIFTFFRNNVWVRHIDTDFLHYFIWTDQMDSTCKELGHWVHFSIKYHK